MPFCTTKGGLVLVHDVKRDEYDKFGELVKVGNGYKPLNLGCGMECDYNPNSKLFKEIVLRGNPDKNGLYWMDGKNPVWRIPTNRFSHQDLNRVYDFYKFNARQPSRQIHYEPAIEDIQISKYGKTGGFHFPMWLIDELLLDGSFERALNEPQVMEPGIKKLTQEDYDALMEAIEDRREQEKELMSSWTAKEKREVKEAIEYREEKREHVSVRNNQIQELRRQKLKEAEVLRVDKNEKNADKIKEKKAIKKGIKKKVDLSKLGITEPNAIIS